MGAAARMAPPHMVLGTHAAQITVEILGQNRPSVAERRLLQTEKCYKSRQGPV